MLAYLSVVCIQTHRTLPCICSLAVVVITNTLMLLLWYCMLLPLRLPLVLLPVASACDTGYGLLLDCCPNPQLSTVSIVLPFCLPVASIVPPLERVKSQMLSKWQRWERGRHPDGHGEARAAAVRGRHAAGIQCWQQSEQQSEQQGDTHCRHCQTVAKSY